MHAVGQIELEARDDGARVGERGAVGNGRARSDGVGIVARHVRDCERDEPRGRGGARKPSALDARQMFAHRVDLANIGAGAQQRARHRLLFREREAARGRDPVGGGAARHQHQHEIVGRRGLRELERARGGIETRLVRHRMARFDHLDRLASAARSRDAPPRCLRAVRAARVCVRDNAARRSRSSSPRPCRRRAGSCVPMPAAPAGAAAGTPTDARRRSPFRTGFREIASDRSQGHSGRRVCPRLRAGGPCRYQPGSAIHPASAARRALRRARPRRAPPRRPLRGKSPATRRSRARCRARSRAGLVRRPARRARARAARARHSSIAACSRGSSATAIDKQDHSRDRSRDEGQLSGAECGARGADRKDIAAEEDRGDQSIEIADQPMRREAPGLSDQRRAAEQAERQPADDARADLLVRAGATRRARPRSARWWRRRSHWQPSLRGSTDARRTDRRRRRRRTRRRRDRFRAMTRRARLFRNAPRAQGTAAPAHSARTRWHRGRRPRAARTAARRPSRPRRERARSRQGWSGGRRSGRRQGSHLRLRGSGLRKGGHFASRRLPGRPIAGKTKAAALF